MNITEVMEDISLGIMRDISFQKGLQPGWNVDFMQGFLAGNMTFLRASAAGVVAADGSRVTVEANMPRFDYDPVTHMPLGLLIEEPRTNYLLNSAAPASQSVMLSTGSYTLSVYGSGSCTAAAGTAVGSGFGAATAAAPLAFTITTAGSVSFTVAGSLSAFQCENGVAPTSFITTTTAAATRAGESCSEIAGSWLNPAEGTIIVEYMRRESDANCVIFRFDAGDATSLAHAAGPTNSRFTNRVDFVTDVNIAIAGAPLPYAIYRQAVAYKLNDYAICRNGGSVLSDTSGNVPASLTRARIGGRSSDSWMNGYVRKVAYYPTRLTNPMLQQLTIL